MRMIVILCLGFSVCSTAVSANSPGMDAPHGHGSPLPWNNTVGPWTGGFNATAAAADWNGDGAADLMVHYAAGGGAKNTLWGTYLYFNTDKPHRADVPVFQKPILVSKNGKPLMWDWNQDGKPDCFIEDAIFINQGDGTFSKIAAPQLPSNAVCIIDWNHDGIPDVFCEEKLLENTTPPESISPEGSPPYTTDGVWLGSADRRAVRFYVGSRSNQSSIVWNDAGLLQSNGLPIEAFGSIHLTYNDWDMDGDPDLMIGTQTQLLYCQNVGGTTQPVLDTPQPVQIGSRFDLPGLVIRPTAFQAKPDETPMLFIAQEDGNVTLLPFRGLDDRGVPSFRKEKHLWQEEALLDAGCLATLSIVDWDADGDLDILSGNSYGHVWLFENSGTRAQPQFSSREYIQADKQPIAIKAGPNGSIQGPGEAHFGYTAPVAVDWNQDEFMDLILSDVWGNHSYYYGHPFNDSLLSPEPLKVAGRDHSAFVPGWMWKKPRFGELVTQWRCQPAVVDWNMDATYDIVTLDSQGYLTFFLAYKTYPTPFLYEPYRAFLYENGEPIRITDGREGKSGRARIVFADWDGDKDLDLIRGCTTAGGHITPNGQNDERVAVWYENTNDDLHFVYRGNLIGLKDVSFAGHATSPAIVDWDHDGKMDLLLGTEDGLIYYFNRNFIASTFK